MGADHDAPDGIGLPPDVLFLSDPAVGALCSARVLGKIYSGNRIRHDLYKIQFARPEKRYGDGCRVQKDELNESYTVIEKRSAVGMMYLTSVFQGNPGDRAFIRNL